MAEGLLRLGMAKERLGGAEVAAGWRERDFMLMSVTSGRGSYANTLQIQHIRG